MSVEPARATHPSFADRLRESLAIPVDSIPRGRGVPQMPGDAAAEQRATPDAGISQTCAQLLVFGAPALDGLVEAVDAQQVAAPERLIAALDRDERVRRVRRQPLQQRRRRMSRAPSTSWISSFSA